MPPRRLLLLPLAAALLFALAGCNTFQSRVRENAAAFNALDAATQARLKSGQIRVGDTMTEVYIALGQPDNQYTATSPAGESVLWIYSHYTQQYEGQAFGGYVPVRVSDPYGHTRVRYVPTSQPVYSTRAFPFLRVTFAHGRVALVERLQP